MLEQSVSISLVAADTKLARHAFHYQITHDILRVPVPHLPGQADMRNPSNEHNPEEVRCSEPSVIVYN